MDTYYGKEYVFNLFEDYYTSLGVCAGFKIYKKEDITCLTDTIVYYKEFADKKVYLNDKDFKNYNWIPHHQNPKKQDTKPVKKRHYQTFQDEYYVFDWNKAIKIINEYSLENVSVGLYDQDHTYYKKILEKGEPVEEKGLLLKGVNDYPILYDDDSDEFWDCYKSVSYEFYRLFLSEWRSQDLTFKEWENIMNQRYNGGI